MVGRSRTNAVLLWCRLWCRVVGLRLVAPLPLLTYLAFAAYSLGARGENWDVKVTISSLIAVSYLPVMASVYQGRYDP
jgi:hypothetical protein